MAFVVLTVDRMHWEKHPLLTPSILRTWFTLPRFAFVPTIGATLLWLFATVCAASPTGAEAIAQLGQVIYAKPATASRTTTLQNGDAALLYRAIYWLCAATRNDLSPESALSMAAYRFGRPMNEPLKRQLLADWHIASSYGLLTSENLASLLAGNAPVATSGRFASQRIEAVKIEQDLAADLTNLAFSPVGFPVPGEAKGNAQTSPASSIPQTSTTVLAVAGAKPPQAELHELTINDTLTIDSDVSLSVGSTSGSELSVTIIGRGPKKAVPVPGTNHQMRYFPHAATTKVAKSNPVQLLGIKGNAYLIDTEPTAKYYYVEDAFSQAGRYQIAKVLTTSTE